VAITLNVGMEKLEWYRYPMVKKFRIIFIRFGATHERDRQTEDSIASRGKIELLVGKMT